ncbi:9552_t:CDS:2 [Scutellospora calospora]|uniref:9552_t:CDS:1 n=1 Tax=Scutellospora calospora TaxID=85575 RepID=A0ACA9K318_9GLOM|nr:9552_t:CDS:2 [Scutellospora calospora]
MRQKVAIATAWNRLDEEKQKANKYTMISAQWSCDWVNAD